MSISRLRGAVRNYVKERLKQTDEFKPVQTAQATLLLPEEASSSNGIVKVYVRNKAVSIFTQDNYFGAQYFAIDPVQSCLKGNGRYVHRHDKSHDSHHQSKSDFQIQHTHILKGSHEPFQTMSLADLRCILSEIKKHEQNNGLCKDKVTDCILSEQDANAIQTNYAKYLDSVRSKAKIEKATDVICEELEKRCIVAAKSFSQAFLTTLLDKYVRPYLINKLHQPNGVTMTLEVIKSAVTYGLNGSLLNTTLDLIIRNGLKTALNTAGVDTSTVDAIINGIGTAIAFTENPLSLVELGLNGTAAAAGQTAAYAVVRTLPKLKIEPEQEPAAPKVEPVRAPGIRHRTICNRK